MFNQKSAYIIKQSSGFVRCFLHIDKVGIVERVLRKNGWSKYDILIKSANKTFAAVLFPDDQITMIFRDNQGNLFLSEYDNSELVSHQLYQNTDNHDIYFEAFAEQNEIHIFYTMPNKRTKSMTVFYQRIDKDFNISPIEIVGNCNFDYKRPFAIHYTDDKQIYVLYQRYTDKHCLGYKVLDKSVQTWSKYQVIDDSDVEFIDFSLSKTKDSLKVIYVKNEDEKNFVLYYDSNDISKEKHKLDEGLDISSCSLYKDNERTWCIWARGDKLSGVFLLSGNKFSTPPYIETMKPENLSKCICLNNLVNDEQNPMNGEIYIYNNNGPDYVVLPKIYNNTGKSGNTDLSLEGYVAGQSVNTMQQYIDEINEKDKIIFELKAEIDRLNILIEANNKPKEEVETMKSEVDVPNDEWMENEE